MEGLTLRRTFDASEVRALLTSDERLLAALGAESPDDVPEMPMATDHYYLVAERYGIPVGLFVFHPRAKGVYQGHANVLSAWWGHPITAPAGNAAISWMFEHTDAHRIVARVPHECPQVQNYALRIGMREVASDSIDKYYEISK